MRRALAGVLGFGLAGCTWIIGDIPVPDDPSVPAGDIAGAWYVYGLGDSHAISGRIQISDTGEVTLGDASITRAETGAGGLWRLDLGADGGRVSGRFDPQSGIGLMVQRLPSDPATFVVLVREPAVRGSLLDGRTLQLELTEAGSPLAEFARLERRQMEVYEQSARLTLTDEVREARQVAVVAEGEGTPRWVARTGDGDWLLSPLVSGDGAIGVRRSDNGSPRGPMLLWRDPVSPELPDRQLFCAGLTFEDGQAASRMREGRILDDRVTWSDGRRGSPSTVGGAAVLEGEASFFDDQGSLVLPDTGGRLFALLPLVPDPGGDLPERSWGLALCIALDVGDLPDAGLDAGLPQSDVGPADGGADPDARPAVDQSPSPDWADVAVERGATPRDGSPTLDAAP